MLLVDVNKITVGYGADIVLREVSIRVGEGERVGMIGRNGEGKTTLLETIMGNVHPESGSIVVPSYIKTVHLRQEQEHQQIKPLFEEMMTVFTEVLEGRKRLKLLETKMEENADDRKLLLEYGHLLEKYEAIDGDSIERRVNDILIGVGFQQNDFEKPMRDLSGGQRNRAALARVLLSGADLLLLDEPTNHLDLNSIEYLENYLKSFPGGAIIISHDRAFLDNVVSSIYEIENHNAYNYPGVNYSQYLPLKEKNFQLRLKIYIKQKEEIARQEEFIRRNIYGQKTKQAKSRRQMLKKMVRPEKPSTSTGTMKPLIGDIARSGVAVLKIEGVSKSFGSNQVLREIGLEVGRGEAVGIIGPNACGKSTLLKIIAAQLPPDSGEVRIGSNVTIGFFGQHRDDIDYSRTLLDQTWDMVPQWEEVAVRSYLGRFLFSGDEPLRIASSLSGGETARLALARLFLQKHNFLVMDEPTNHLDIASREVLEETLSDFPGTLLIVSHDRYFLNGIVDKICAFENGELRYYAGDYGYYAEKRKEFIIPEPIVSSNPQPKTDAGKSLQSYLESKERSRRQQRLKKMEAEIESLENRINDCREELHSEVNASDWERLSELEALIRELEGQLARLLDQWEQTHNLL